MLKAVLDTNVLISAFIYGGVPREVFEKASQGKFVNVTSEHILDEVRRILKEKLQASEPLVSETVNSIISSSDLVNPVSALNVVKDEADNRVLVAALDSHAHYIVTGDSGLLGLGEYKGIAIVNPREFLSRLIE